MPYVIGPATASKAIDNKSIEQTGDGSMPPDDYFRKALIGPVICVVTAAISGVLCGKAFDPGLGWLMLFGIAPFLVSLTRCGVLSGAFAGITFFGTFYGVVFRWLSFFGWLPVFALLTVVFLPFGAIIGGLAAGLGNRHPERTILLASGLLIFHEVFRQMGYASVPWAQVSHALTPELVNTDNGLVGASPSLLLAVIAPVLGATGVSLVVIACNAGIALGVGGRGRLRLAGGAVVAIVLALALFPSPSTSASTRGKAQGIQVATVQTATPTTIPWTPEVKHAVLGEYAEEVKKAQAGGARIIILPESFAQESDYPGSPLQWMISRDWLERGRVIFYGAGFVNKNEDHSPDIYPAFILLDKRGFREAILKHQLVPMGEYIVFRKFLVSWFPNYPWTPQDSQAAGFVHPVRVKGFSVGALICYESLYSGLARRLVLSGAEFLISATNSSWFGDTKATEQMVRFEVFRALESGRYFVRAGTAGISSFIAPSGHITKALPQFVTGSISAVVYPGKWLTFYVRHGEFLPWLIWSLTILATFQIWLSSDRRSPVHTRDR